jgi:hypothetical protein
VWNRSQQSKQLSFGEFAKQLKAKGPRVSNWQTKQGGHTKKGLGTPFPVPLKIRKRIAIMGGW